MNESRIIKNTLYLIAFYLLAGVFLQAVQGFAQVCQAQAGHDCWYVSNNGSDSGSGSFATPFKTIEKGISVLEPGDVLYLRGGEYRLMNQGSTRIAGFDTTSENHLTIRGYPGERVILLGSLDTQGMQWERHSDHIWRVPADFLENDPTGMFERQPDHFPSIRIAHATDLSGTRSHDDVVNMDANTWTKADANGVGCDRNNTGCYIYICLPGRNPNNAVYELSQRGAFYSIGVDYTVFSNLEVYYTQSAGLFTEGCDNITIKNSIFGHNSNGNDNSYALRIWSCGGARVINNIVFDSVYWGGYSNSKGITFMVADPENPHIVEYNEIFDIPGSAAIGTKGGVAGLIARYNFIHDVALAFSPGHYRCVWSSTNTDGCQPSDEEYRPAGSWRIYGNIVKNADTGIDFPGYHETIGSGSNALYNNVLYNVKTAVRLGWDGEYGNVIANNIFMTDTSGIYLHSGGMDTVVADYLDQFESYHNLYFDNILADIHLRPNWGGSYSSGIPYRLEAFKSEFPGREAGSRAADPLFIDPVSNNFSLQDSSPALNAGDGAFFEETAVNMGAYVTGGETVGLIDPSCFPPGVVRSTSGKAHIPGGCLLLLLED